MTKPIENYTADELSKKIESIKAERERTANALKRYEEELERRKNSAKYESADVLHVEMKLETIFNDYSCFDKYRAYLEALNKELVANARGEPIDIKVLLPLLRKGWVAMDKDGKWFWYPYKPIKEIYNWRPSCGILVMFFFFNLKPAENWEDSLMECGV